MNNGFFAKVFGELLATHGLKQGEAAEKVGVEQSTISLWLSGKRHPTYAQLQKIVNVFTINPARLFQWE